MNNGKIRLLKIKENLQIKLILIGQSFFGIIKMKNF